MSRSVSRGCSPTDGSSSTYSVPTRPVPSAVARAIRCDSPPERRGRGAVEGQVVEPDVLEERQPAVHLVERSRAAIARSLGGELEAGEEAPRLPHRHGAQTSRIDGPPSRTRSASGRSRLPPQAGHSW